MRAAALLIPVLVCLGAPASAQSRWVRHYQERVAAFEAENRALEAGKRHVVLVGDSLTEGFNAGRVGRYLPSLAERVLNRGIASDRVGPPRGVLSRLESSIFEAQASHVVLLIGVNQIGSDGSGVRGALKHYRTILERLKDKAPELPLILVTQPPARGAYQALNPHIRRFNAGVATLATEFGHTLLDLHPLLADADGTLRPGLTRDGLHWTDGGYELYGREIERTIQSAEAEAEGARGSSGSSSGAAGALEDQ